MEKYKDIKEVHEAIKQLQKDLEDCRFDTNISLEREFIRLPDEEGWPVHTDGPIIITFTIRG